MAWANHSSFQRPETDTLWMGICWVRPYTVTHPTWIIFCGAVSLVLVESTWCDYDMVEADSHLKLIPTFILHIYKVFEHLDMLSIGIHQQPNIMHTNWIRFWGSGLLVESTWCHNVVVEAEGHLKLLPTSTLDIYKVFEHIDMLSMSIQQ
jgi:hypothetical protein